MPVSRTDRSQAPQMHRAIPAHDRPKAVATLLSVSAVLMAMSYCYWNIQQDDSYIFYSYARNLANGDGYVFNTGERINATTSPLYTLILSLASLTIRHIAAVDLPLIGHFIGAASLFFTCLFLMQSLRTEGSSAFPFLLPLVFLLNPLLPNAVGMETFLAMMLAVMCLYLYSRSSLLPASMACSLAVLARPDMLLLALVMASYDAILKRRLPSIRMILLFVSPIASWLFFSHSYFGDLLPSTLSAKLGQTESGRWGTGLIFLKGLLYESIWQGKAPRHAAFAAMLLGLAVLVLRFRRWSILRHPVVHLILIWNATYLAVYGFVLNPPAYPWYYTPLSLGAAIVMTLPLEGCDRLLSGKDTARTWVVVVLLLVLALACLQIPLQIARGPVSAKYENYKLAAEWLNANVRAGSTVGANEIGVLRYYFAKGPIIDGLGLVTPEVADHVQQRDYAWYVHRYRPDYLMFNNPHRPLLESMVESDWFQRDYALSTIIATPRRAVAIYKRQN